MKRGGKGMVEISAKADRLIKQKIWLTLESTHRTSETRLNFFMDQGLLMSIKLLNNYGMNMTSQLNE